MVEKKENYREQLEEFTVIRLKEITKEYPEIVGAANMKKNELVNEILQAMGEPVEKEENKDTLTGMKEISNFVNRSEATVLGWIQTMGFPADKKDLVFISSRKHIEGWIKRTGEERRSTEGNMA